MSAHFRHIHFVNIGFDQEPATHGYILFLKALHFSRHEGRLLNPTAENIRRAKEGRFTFCFLRLIKAKETPYVSLGTPNRIF